MSGAGDGRSGPPDSREAASVRCACGGQRAQETNAALTKRLNRIEGQIRGIRGMVEKGVYCDDILTQFSAVRSALDAAARLLLDSHIKTCVAPRLRDDDPEILEEFLHTVERMVK